MVVTYDAPKISRALHDFYSATGITIDLLKSDFTKVSDTKYEFNNYCKCIQGSKSGAIACKNSEITLLEKCKSLKETQFHICHAGLIDMVTPIIHEDEIIGYIIFARCVVQAVLKSLKNTYLLSVLTKKLWMIITAKSPFTTVAE